MSRELERIARELCARGPDEVAAFLVGLSALRMPGAVERTVARIVQ